MLKTVSLKYQNTTVDFLFYKYDDENNVNDCFEYHKHLNYEIHFARDGCYEYKFNDRNIVLHKNEMLIIPPEKMHRMVKSKEKNYEFTVLTLKFSSDGSDHFYNYFRSIFEKNALKCLKVQAEVTEAVFKLNDDENIVKSDCLQSIYLSSCASEILYKLCLLLNGDDKKWSVSNKEKNSEFQIENLVNANLSITEIANKINYSTRQTERLIKKIYGKSLSEMRRGLS